MPKDDFIIERKFFHNLEVNSWEEAFELLKNVGVIHYLIALEEIPEKGET